MSQVEDLFAFQCKAAKIKIEREFKFCPDRKFRADFLLVGHMVLIELEGGIWLAGKGGHTSGTGITRDCAKHSLAASLGYRVYRFTPDMVKSGEALNMIEEEIKQAESAN